jgi:hypothetical protein
VVKRLRLTKAILFETAAAVLMVVLVLLVLPPGAEAKFPAETGNQEAPPGITVTGIGFGPTDADAVDRAVADARRRGADTARALRLGLGGVEGVELPELTQFGVPCQGGSGECGRPAPAAAAATVTFAIVGGATGDDLAGSIRVHGAASASIASPDRSRNRSIKRALRAARRTLAPRAATAARRNAGAAAAAAGIQLGTIVSAAEATAPYYYGPGFYDTALGWFGPGRFCGIVRQPIVRRDPETGVPTVVRRVPRRRCFASSPYTVRFAIRYEVG